MTSKERAALRAQANSLEPLFHVGKGGISDALIVQVKDVFETRELIKLKVLLETTPEPPKEIAQKIAEAADCEVVQVIGGAMIFYKYTPALHTDKSKIYENPIKEKVPVKRKSAPKVKKGTAVKPNSRKKALFKKAKERATFTIRDSKNLKKPK